MSEKETKRQPVSRARDQREEGFGSIVVVAISAVIILIVVWFLANAFIDMTGKKEMKEKAASSQETSVAVTASESAENRSEQAAPASTEVVDGPADPTAPSTWVGKSFATLDGVNVRSGMGTDTNILGTIPAGTVVHVTEADFDGTVVWVRATYEVDGVAGEGWLYTGAINPMPASE